jgi:hypothetical protein
MQWLKELVSSLRFLYRRRQAEQQLHEELQFHLQRQIEQNLAAGMPPEEARYAALRLFGGVQQVTEECRDMRRLNFAENLFQDVRYALRLLIKSPGFTSVIILSLALGIGAYTAIFSLINAALLKMLAVVAPEQLVTIGCSADDSFPYPAFSELRDRNRVFSGVLAFRTLDNFDFDVDGRAGLAKGQVVSGNYYSVLGVNAILGRTITPQDEKIEIGLRMALGARRGQILGMVMRETAWLLAGGVGIGLPLALAASRLVSSMLFGLKSTDPTTVATATFILVAVVALAGYLPARRASQVDPMVALRYE